MNGSWYLVKHVPDLMRDEPVNIGIVLVGEGADQYAARFMAEDPDGHVDGRRIPRDFPPATYKAWIQFVRKAAARGELDERIKRLQNRSDNIRIERRGSIIEDHAAYTLQQRVDGLFEHLVAEIEPSRGRPTVEKLANAALARLKAKIEHDVTVTGALKGVPQTARFDYRYTNGRVTLMDRLATGLVGSRLEEAVNGLLHRITIAEASDVQNFVVMHAGPDTAALEKQLNIIEQYANTIDLDDEGAPVLLSEVLHVPMLEQPSGSPELVGIRQGHLRKLPPYDRPRALTELKKPQVKKKRV